MACFRFVSALCLIFDRPTPKKLASTRAQEPEGAGTLQRPKLYFAVALGTVRSDCNVTDVLFHEGVELFHLQRRAPQSPRLRAHVLISGLGFQP